MYLTQNFKVHCKWINMMSLYPSHKNRNMISQCLIVFVTFCILLYLRPGITLTLTYNFIFRNFTQVKMSNLTTVTQFNFTYITFPILLQTDINSRLSVSCKIHKKNQCHILIQTCKCIYHM